MSPQPSWSVARTELERVADDLRAKGYEVFVEPSASEVPDFVREYQPDILARGSNESLIVEVKQPLSESERERIRTIARRVEGHPGWRFMLVAPERSARDSEPFAVRPVDKQQVRNWLNEARTPCWIWTQPKRSPRGVGRLGSRNAHCSWCSIVIGASR